MECQESLVFKVRFMINFPRNQNLLEKQDSKFLDSSWIYLLRRSNRRSSSELSNYDRKMNEGRLVQYLPCILGQRCSVSSILSINLFSGAMSVFSLTTSRLICSSSSFSFEFSLQDQKLSQIELCKRSNSKMSLSQILLFNFFPSSFAIIIFQRLCSDSHFSLQTLPIAESTLSLTSLKLKPKLTNLILMRVMRSMIRVTAPFSIFCSGFIIFNFIKSKYIQYLIILSRLGEQRFHEFVPFLMPAITTNFMKKRYGIEETQVKEHVNEIKLIKEQFLVTHRFIHYNAPTAFKPIYLQHQINHEQWPCSIMQKGYFDQICNHIIHEVSKLQEKYILLYRLTELIGLVASRLSQKLNGNELNSIKYLNFAHILQEPQCNFMKGSTILFLQYYQTEEQPLLNQIIDKLKNINLKIEYFKFPKETQFASSIVYPQFISISEYINVNREIEEQSIKPIIFPRTAKKQILVYYDIDQPEGQLEVDDYNPDQIEDTLPPATLYRKNQLHSWLNDDLEIFICDRPENRNERDEYLVNTNNEARQINQNEQKGEQSTGEKAIQAKQSIENMQNHEQSSLYQQNDKEQCQKTLSQLELFSVQFPIRPISLQQFQSPKQLCVNMRQKTVIHRKSNRNPQKSLKYKHKSVVRVKLAARTSHYP